MRKQKRRPRSQQRRRNKLPKKRPLHLHISQHFSIKDFLGPPPEGKTKPTPYKISLGLIGMNTFGVQEKNWGYRFIEKSPLFGKIIFFESAKVP